MLFEANNFSSALNESLVLLANIIKDVGTGLKIDRSIKFSAENTKSSTNISRVDPGFARKVSNVLKESIATEGKDIPIQEWLRRHKLTRLESEQYPAARRLFAQALVDTYGDNDNALTDLMVAFNWPSYQKDKVKKLVNSLIDVLSGTNEWIELISLVEVAREEGKIREIKEEMRRLDNLIIHHHAGMYFKEDVVQNDFALEEAEKIEKLYRDSLVKEYYFHELSLQFNMTLRISLPLSDIYFELGSMFGNDETGFKGLVEDLFGYPITESKLGSEQNSYESILESIVRNKKLVILGEPGSGKSMTLKFIALMLATDYGTVRIGYQVPYIPLMVSWDGFVQASSSNKSLTLAEYILDVTQRKYGNITRLKEYLSLALKNGVCLILLDDFNFNKRYSSEGHPVKNQIKYDKEISSTRELDELFSNSDLSLCPLLISGRLGTKQKMDFQGFRLIRLSPLVSEDNARDFLSRWIESFLKTSKPVKNTLGILERSNGKFWVNPFNFKIRQVFSNPLLLTIVGIQFSYIGYLPDRSTRIYEFIIDFMVETWWREKIRLSEYRDMNLDVGIIGRILSSIAFWMHSNFTDGRAAMSLWIDQISQILSLEGIEEEDKHIFMSFLTEQEVGKVSPIIYHEEGKYGFFHPVIEDYLTVRYMARLSNNERKKILKMFIKDEKWENIFLLLVSQLGLNEGRKREASEFVNALINLENSHLNPMIHPVLIAGRALAVMGPYCITKSIEDNVIHRLKSLMWDINYSTDRPNILFNVPIVLRVKAADLLDELEWLPEDLFELIFITDFSESNASPQARKKEFWIGKYPVTNIQYERFLNADDFLDPVLWEGFPKYDENSQELKDDWGTAGWMWVNDPVLGKVDMNGRIFPRFWDDIMFGITHRVVPVIGITWFEANAYCRWVQRHWEELEESRSKKGFNRPIVRLPTELEWEFTAGKTGTGNSFPWDSSNTSSTSQEVPNRANVREGGINRTTPVGMYPLGKSYPHGVWDMAGNVWEWQANYFDSRRDTIAIRGGSWYDSLNRSRRSSRNHSYPHNLWDGLGFRILARNS